MTIFPYRPVFQSRCFRFPSPLCLQLMSIALGAAPLLLLPILFVGLAGFEHRRRQNGVVFKEIYSRRDVWIVAGVAAAGIALMLASPLGRWLGLAWAPYACGAAVASLLFAVMELSYRGLRARLAAEPVPSRAVRQATRRPEWLVASLALVAGAAFAAPAATVPSTR